MSTQPDTLKQKFFDVDIRSFFSKTKPNSKNNQLDSTISTTCNEANVQLQEDATISMVEEVNAQEDGPQQNGLEELNHEEDKHEDHTQEVLPQEVDHEEEVYPQEVDHEVEVPHQELNPQDIDHEGDPQEVYPQEDDPQEVDHEEEDPQEVYPQEDDPQEVEVEEFDIDSIERDPGLRLHIWEYPVNKRKEVREAYLKMGPYQWKPIVGEYPLTQSGIQKRKFNSRLFERFPWLEYSSSKDRVYCLPCFLFESRHPQYPAFTSEGFNSWKRIGTKNTCSLLQHVGGITSQHMMAVSSCEDLMTPSSHIDNVMRTKCQEETMKNRIRVGATIECVRWLALQGCAFRGHDETNDSDNCGNFIELLKFLAKLSAKVAEVVLENAPGNAMYYSHGIQKQVLHLLAENVREHIRREVGDSKFCVLVDEAQDNAYREQMAIILRFVDGDGYVRERFFAIMSVKDTNASTLKDAIFHVLAKYNLQICNLRGQGYDGASNMRGAWNGLQALILEQCPHAYYIHCFAHRLQLALVGASSAVDGVWRFFSELAKLVNFVNASPKRRTELKEVRKAEIEQMVALGEIGTSKGANQIRSLQRGGDTRWSSHFASVHSVIDMFGSICTVVLGINMNGSSNAIRGEASGHNIQLKSFDCVFLLHLMQRTMGITDLLCKALQNDSQDILNAISLVSTTIKLLEMLRSEGWHVFLEEVLSFCAKNDVNIPDMSARYMTGTGRLCQQKDFISIEHHYHMDVFINVIERQVVELQSRFKDEAVELLRLSYALDPSEGFKSFNPDDICNLAEKFYYHDFSDQDIHILRSQLQHYALDVVCNENFKKLSTLSELCHELAATKKSKVYNLVDKLIRLVLTLPVSTATTERAFSAMKLLKTDLRNKMEDVFLGDCMVIYIERQFAKNINVDLVIDEFDELTDRRVRLR